MKAYLNLDDLIEVGYNSNHGERKYAKYIFLTATLDAAIRVLNIPRKKVEKEFI
jgi:hypothetical protein